MGSKVAMVMRLDPQIEWMDKMCVVDMAPVDMRSMNGISSFAQYIKVMKSVPEGIQSIHEADEILKREIPQVAVRQFLLTNLKPVGDSYRWRINLDTLGRELSELWTFPGSGTHEGEVLFVRGGKSDYVKLEMWPLVQSYFPNAKLVTIEGAGHWVHAERPAEFVKTVVEFFK